MKTIYIKTTGTRINAQPGQKIVTPSGETRKGYKAKQVRPSIMDFYSGGYYGPSTPAPRIA